MLRNSRKLPLVRQATAGQTLDGALNPVLYLLVDLARVAAGGRDGGSYDDAHNAGFLQPAAARPIAARVMCYRNDELVLLGRQQSAAHPVLSGLPVRHTGAFGEN